MFFWVNDAWKAVYNRPQFDCWLTWFRNGMPKEDLGKPFFQFKKKQLGQKVHHEWAISVGLNQFPICQQQTKWWMILDVWCTIIIINQTRLLNKIASIHSNIWYSVYSWLMDNLELQLFIFVNVNIVWKIVDGHSNLKVLCWKIQAEFRFNAVKVLNLKGTLKK